MEGGDGGALYTESLAEEGTTSPGIREREDERIMPDEQ